MWRYYKKVWNRFRADFRASLGEQVIGVLLALGILALQISFGVIHPSDVRASFWAVAYPYLLLVAVFFLWHVVRVPAKIDDEQCREGQQLRNRCSELENEIESKTPLLSVVIHDALLISQFMGARVFVDAEVSNERFGTQATIRGYRLQLERSGTEYISENIKTDLSDWQIYDVVDIGNEGEPNLVFENHKRLPDLALDINHLHPIVNGVPRRGWLHFDVDTGVWPGEAYRDAGLTGYQHEIADGDSMRLIPEEWFDAKARRINTKEAKNIMLTIFAPGGSTGNFLASINHSGKREIRMIPKKRIDTLQ